MELLKIQLQNAGRLRSLQKSENKTVTNLSATRIALNIIREKGVFGLYKGARATACRDISFSIVYFPLFATLNQLGPRRKDGSGDAAFFVSFGAGCAAAAVSAWSVTPFDVAKTRIQALTKAEGEMQFSGIIDCFR